MFLNVRYLDVDALVLLYQGCILTYNACPETTSKFNKYDGEGDSQPPFGNAVAGIATTLNRNVESIA